MPQKAIMKHTTLWHHDDSHRTFFCIRMKCQEIHMRIKDKYHGFDDPAVAQNTFWAHICC